MTNKDEILANFQACSGIDDVGEAFTRLEASNWNLAEAVNAIYEQSSATSHGLGAFGAVQADVVAIDIAHDMAVPPLAAEAAPPGVGNATATNDGGGSVDSGGGAAGGGVGSAASGGDADSMLHINIKVLVGGLTGNGEFPLEVPSTTTVGELKATLYQLLGVTPCKQVLQGFRGDVTDSTVLTADLLGEDNTLTINTATADTSPFVPYRREPHTASTAGNMDIGSPLQPWRATNSFSSLSNLPATSSDNSSSSSKKNNSSSKSGPLKSIDHYSNINKAGSSSASSYYQPSARKAGHSSSSISSTGKDTIDISGAGGSNSSSGGIKINPVDDKDGLQYQLFLTDTTNNGDYTLCFPGSKTVVGVKQGVADITAIPVHRQQWIGWPKGVTDEMTLSSSGVSTTLSLSVSAASPPTNRSAAKKSATKTESESSSDEFEDAPELLQEEDDSFLEMMEADIADTKPTCLLPATVEGSEQTLVDHFVAQFSERYGSLAPFFFQGPLREAVGQSIMLPIAQRRMLAIYIHEDSSVLANVFCSQVLCQTGTVSFLADNFVLWGWDITQRVHKDRLVFSITALIGAAAGQTVVGFKSTQLPALMLVTRSRGNCEVLSVMYAATTSSLDEVVTGLMGAVEVFEDTKQAELAEDLERQNRQTIMSDQDAAYQASLMADRAKVELKRQIDEDEQREIQRQQNIKLHEQEITQKLRASLESELPPEPQNHDSPDVTVMRFRPPGTELFKRAFLLNTSLQVVLNFLHVRGFPADKYKFLQSWPRRDIASLNVSLTLKDFDIPQQETITIEER